MSWGAGCPLLSRPGAGAPPPRDPLAAPCLTHSFTHSFNIYREPTVHQASARRPGFSSRPEAKSLPSGHLDSRGQSQYAHRPTELAPGVGETWGAFEEKGFLETEMQQSYQKNTCPQGDLARSLGAGA